MEIAGMVVVTLLFLQNFQQLIDMQKRLEALETWRLKFYEEPARAIREMCSSPKLACKWQVWWRHENEWENLCMHKGRKLTGGPRYFRLEMTCHTVLGMTLSFRNQIFR